MKTKFLLLLLLLSFGIYGQNPTKFEKIKITANTQDNGVARILVQDATTGEVKWILKSILDGKFNQPTGDATQYLDGAGNPTTFPVLSQSDRVVAEVRNQTGATVTKGTVVYLNGASGGKALIQKAQANAESTSSGTFGVIQSDINNNANGYAIIIGTVSGLNTSTYTAGNVLWLSPTVAGTFTTTKPSAPNHAVYVGIVTASSTTQGTIEVKIQNGYELDELHDVSIVSKTNNDALIYDSATGLWKNKQFVNDAIVDGTTTVAPSQNAVFDALATKEPTIASGTTAQYYRGDKTWQTLDKTAVGLSNVDNTSDVNKPISTATQTALNAKQNTSEKNQVNGYAGLGSDGKLISAQLPSITITDTFVVGSQSAMLALTAETGDVVVRTDLSKSYILKGTNPSVLEDWKELLSPVDGVTSVFGRVGSVTAQTGDYTTAQVTETTNKKYQTDNQALYNDATSSIQTQLNSKVQASTSTANYLSKFTGSGTNIGNSQIFDNGQSVIVGGSGSTGAKLHVVETSTSQSGMLLQNTNTSSNANLFQMSLRGTGKLIDASDATSTLFTVNNSGGGYFKGNTGIGTTTPSQKLTIGDGTGTGNQYLRVNSSASDIYIGQSGSGLFGFSANSASYIVSDNTSSPFVFGTIQNAPFYIGTNGVTRATITTSGYMGLGTQTPSEMLEVQNGATGAKIKVSNSGGGSASLGISSNASSVASLNFTNQLSLIGGNVGIGTTSPLSILHLKVPSATDNYLYQEVTSSNTWSGNLIRYNGTDYMGSIGNVSTGEYKIGGFNNTGYFTTIYTNNAERMRITSNGNVGIGTTSPNYKLQVSPVAIYGNAEDGNISIANSASGGTNNQPTSAGGIVFGDQNNTNSYMGRIAVIQDNPSSSTSSHMRFYTNNGGGNSFTLERMRIAGNGNLSIGKTLANWTSDGLQTEDLGQTLGVTNSSAANNLFLRKNGVAGNVVNFYYNGGSVGTISITSSATSYNTSSDYRLKQDLKSFSGLDLLSKMKVYDYQWKSDKTRAFGVMAHELQAIIPQAVTGEKDAEQMQAVDYSKLVPILIQSIQELQKEIEILKNK